MARPDRGAVVILTISIVTWLYLQPALERCVTFEIDWIAQMYARNLGLMIATAGGLHLYFYTFRKQGKERQVRRSGSGPRSQGIPVRKPGVGQHVLDAGERRHDLDGVRSSDDVGLRERLCALPHLERQSGLVPGAVPRDPDLGVVSLLLDPPLPALAAALPSGARAASPATSISARGRACRCIRWSMRYTSPLR